MSKQNVAVIVLAGGKGKRMATHSSLPKALLPVADRPVLLRVLDTIAQSGIAEKPMVVVGYKKEAIKKAVGRRAYYAWQKEQLGTGHATLIGLRSLLRNKLRNMLRSTDHVVILYGDHPFISSRTLQKLFRLCANGSAVALATAEVPDFRGVRGVFKKFGRIVRDKRGIFKADVEAVDATKEELRIKEINTGFYCFNIKWLQSRLQKLDTQNAQGEYYLTDLLALAVQEKKKVGIVKLDSWVEAMGINSPEDFTVVNRLAKTLE